MKKGKRRRLSTQLVVLIIVFWVIPIAFFLFFTNYLLNSVMNRQATESVMDDMESTVAIIHNNLTTVLEDARLASRERVLLTAYEEYFSPSQGTLNILYKATTDYLNNSYEYKNLIEYTMLEYYELPDQTYIAYNFKESVQSGDDRRQQEFFLDEVKKTSRELGTRFDLLVRDNELYLVRNIVDRTFNPIAVMLLKLNSDDVFFSLISTAFMEGAIVTINDENISYGNEIIDMGYSEDGLYQLDSYTYDLFVNSKLEYINIDYTMRINIFDLLQGYFLLRRVIFIFLFAAVPLLMLMIFTLYKSYMSPINQLLTATEKIEGGELGYQISTNFKSREFSFLTRRFNSMSQKLKEYLQRQYEEHMATQEMKIRALQSQINPHFLNNTLEVINWELRLKETEKATEMVESLSTLLGASMSRNNSSKITLKEELEYVEAYLYITSVRMGERLKVTKSIDESLLGFSLPLLIVEPMVENAIEHGISYRGNGTLNLLIYAQDDFVVIDITTDNTLSEEDRSRIEALMRFVDDEQAVMEGYSNVGIRNVNQRLRLFYGDDYLFTVTPTADNGTLTRMKIPYTKN